MAELDVRNPDTVAASTDPLFPVAAAGGDSALVQAAGEARAKSRQAAQPATSPVPDAVQGDVAKYGAGGPASMPSSGDPEKAAIAEWQKHLGSDQDIINLKKTLYWAGMYGNSSVSLLETINDNDVAALQQAMRLGSLNGQDWSAVVRPMAEQGLQANTPFDKLGVGTDTDETTKAQTALEQFASANGITLSKDYLTKTANAIGTGQATLDDTLAGLRTNYVAQAYPAWAKQIEAGQDVSDLAQPYLQTMSSMLDLPGDAVNLQDKTVQRALAAVDEKGNPSYMPLWQFKEEVRKDPRWASSEDGWNTIGQMYKPILDAFGVE